MSEQNTDQNIDQNINQNSNQNSTENNQENLNEIKKKSKNLVLERSLYILKRKFEIHKKELEAVYDKYRHKNYKKLKAIDVNYLVQIYDEIFKTTRFKLIPYTNSKEVISADLMMEINQNKRNMVFRSLEKFTLKNIQKYNKLYYEEKMRAKKLLEEEQKKKEEEDSQKKEEEEKFNTQVKIVRKNKRGKIINDFEEMLKINKEFDVGDDILSSINEDDAIILDNNQLLYTEVFRTIIADFLQDTVPNGTYSIALIPLAEDLDNDEESKLNEDVKKLYDNELIEINTNIVKLDPVEEKKEKLKSLLLELMNIENQIKIYDNLIVENISKGNNNVKHLITFMEKLKEQKKFIEEKLKKINIELNGNISILNNNITETSETKKESNSHKFSQFKIQNKKYGSYGKYSIDSVVKETKNVKKSISNHNIDKLIDIKIDETNGSVDKYKYNYNRENFYYNHGIKDPETKAEFRRNNLLEIFYFYTKQHSFIGQTPSFQEILKSEEHLDLAEFAKFCTEFKIMVKPQKIMQIFKKNATNGKEMNFEGFINILIKLSSYVNEEKKQYIQERIKLNELKLKEIKEKNKNENLTKPNDKIEEVVKSDGEENNNKKTYVSTNLKYYQKSKKKVQSNAKIKKILLIKSKTNVSLMTDTEDEIQEKISKLKNDYNSLKEKTEEQLEEEFYQYLEIDEPNLYRKKMVGYIYPFQNRENESRFPLKSVARPVIRDEKVQKEIHKTLVRRIENLKKQKEEKEKKEKEILFEKRKKKFEVDNKKLVDKINRKNDYRQLKINEEDYQRQKLDKLTWKMIQTSDYDNFILNEKGKNKSNLDEVFTNESNLFEGDDENFLKSFKIKKGIHESQISKTNGNEINNNMDNNTNNDNTSSFNKYSVSNISLKTESNAVKLKKNGLKNKAKINSRYGS